MNVLRKDDYILITDISDDKYLKIGEIIKLEHISGDTKYTVRFGYNKETSKEDLKKYGYELANKCRILDFR